MTAASRFFDRGDEIVVGGSLASAGVSDPERRLVAEWGEFCQDSGLALNNTDGNRWVPRLTGLRRDRHFEVYDIEAPGLLGTRIEVLSEMLLTSRRAMSESTIEIRPGVYRVVLNHLELPDLLPFDAARVPDSPDSVYFGATALGGDLVWDLTDKYHGVIVGESGGGKTEAAVLALLQLHAKGWELIVITPTTDDTAFTLLAELGHTVIAGTDPGHYHAASEIIEAQTADIAVRERARAAAGTAWYEGRRSLLVIDESPDVLEDRKTDPPETRAAKQVIRAGVDVRARRGRKVRHHLLVMTQEPYISAFGTPETFRQLTFRLAVTGLDQVFQPVVFQRSGDHVAPNVRRVLSNPQSPKGRGIARGALRTTDNEYSIVDEVPVQVAWCPPERQHELTGHPARPARHELEVVA